MNSPTLDPLRLVGDTIYNANEQQQFSLDLRYFKVRLFQKGTMHITFTNQRVLDKLNIFGGQRKNWLPPAYGTKPYNDFPPEEKSVIDEFQGKEAYAEICQNPGFYLVQPDTFLLTAGENNA